MRQRFFTRYTLSIGAVLFALNSLQPAYADTGSAQQNETTFSQKAEHAAEKTKTAVEHGAVKTKKAVEHGAVKTKAAIVKAAEKTDHAAHIAADKTTQVLRKTGDKIEEVIGGNSK